MRTIFFIAWNFAALALAANEKSETFTVPGTQQGIQIDTAKNCLTLRNGKVIIVQNGKATPLKQDTTFANGTKITTNGTIIKKDGSKMAMRSGECFSTEGVRMSNAYGSHVTQKKPQKK